MAAGRGKAAFRRKAGPAFSACSQRLLGSKGRLAQRLCRGPACLRRPGVMPTGRAALRHSAIKFQNIRRAHRGQGAAAQKVVGALAQRRENAARHGKHILAVAQGRMHSVHGAGDAPRLGHAHAAAQRGNQPVALQKVRAQRLGAGRYSPSTRPCFSIRPFSVRFAAG